MNEFERFREKVNGSLNKLEVSIAFLNEGLKGLSNDFNEFKEDFTDFMVITSKSHSDHEKRISDLERKNRNKLNP